ncbi:(2Fe-2S)-binding protein [Lentiprolixibacter aurantiacus]|uniref:(2Fe-2S)-binding protein n=1 Tax=Lentiprolixibacter aurantiacus TaxID=2993939 RepID=A0AAE3MK41_9FLAO|nr:(2Fe-2S)-binding protein [Lentiprolixibacter aurantiacus]MCX2718597.1 (2Fe-2S)-binding protein [Lentiprolixibacter aurantiacus]
MPSYSLNINSKSYVVDVPEGTSLLWVLREHLGLTGTKYSCGIAQCGTCTIHIDGKPSKACVVPINGVANGERIKTIEGLSEKGDHPVQKAWVEEQVPQCGYCQSGQIMQAVALLEQNPKPSREEIKSFMNPVMCRCGTYMRILKAIERASESSTL